MVRRRSIRRNLVFPFIHPESRSSHETKLTLLSIACCSFLSITVASQTAAVAIAPLAATDSASSSLISSRATDPTFELSLGVSSLSFKKDDYGAQFAKDTIAFLPKLQIRIPNSTFSLVVKGAYATIDYEDYCAFDSTGLAIGFEG